MYLIELGVGTPPQHILAQFDTGSSDLWVYSVDNPMCQYNGTDMDQVDCTFTGTFNSSASSTFREIEKGKFSDTYGGGYSVSGDWVWDRVIVGGTENGLVINNMRFGLGHFANASAAILGLGYPGTNNMTQQIGGTKYRSLPQQLAADGTIVSAAFSIWLNDADASEGSVLFVPILNGSNKDENDEYVSFLIALSQIVVSTVSREGTFEEKETVDLLNGTTIQALLDSGATKSFLPLELLSDFLYTTLNATDDEDVGGTIFDCNLIMDESLPPVKFNFSGAIIEVPISSFADEVEGDEGKCMFGIYQFGLPFALLGDAVLRQAYVVYDMEHHEIGLGQALLNVTGEEESIEVISGEIPKATKASLYSQISALTGGYFSLLSENGVTGGSTYSDSGTSAGTATRIGITGMSERLV
ncbi:uncharacterized protein SAPINGB_P000206 [Magnusiomyces paraingens]|uniref:Peptidase A1 domain-containing protein n=1 Tax=Magnusiomyces paraingens TaxID=2606893 RepID=A0A5E8AYS1_9ASCO|nr:uncharacterized protein SAPINGB_P000206 [Saprochaete ingens]VVT43908.1 unnamed protein product [Saprochaete ingens]